MAIAYPSFVVQAGQGIELDGAFVGLSDTFYGYLNNAGLAGGVVVTDETNSLIADPIATRDTWANLDTADYIPEPGQLLSVNEQLFQGNSGGQKYGVPIGVASESVTLVAPTRTPTQSAAAFVAAYTRAIAKTPYETALGGTNRHKLIILPGYYDFSAYGAKLQLTTEYVDVVGLSPNANDAVLKFDGTNILEIAANDIWLHNFTVYGTTGSYIAVTASPLTSMSNAWHKNLRIINTGGGGINTLAVLGGGDLGGLYEDIYANVTGGYVYPMALITGSGSCSATFRRVYIENASSGVLGGGLNTSNYIPFTGTVDRCTLIRGTTGVGWYIRMGGLMTNCFVQGVVASGRDAIRANDGGRFYNNLIKHQGTGGTAYSIGDSGSAINVQAHGNLLSANGLDTSITNASGLSNTSSDNWSF